jgi:hypothetical protein
VKSNLLPTSCRLCSVKLPAQAGAWLEDRKITLCLECLAKDQARERKTVSRPVAARRETSTTHARVRLLWNPRDKVFMARAFAIAGGLLERFTHACGEAGCSYSSSLGNYGKVELVPAAIERLEAYGFTVDIVPELATVLEQMASVVRAGSIAGVLRAERLDRRAAQIGKVVRPYQKVGIAWLASHDAAVLADPTGVGKGLQTLGALDPEPRAVIVCKAIMKGCYVDGVPRGGWADEIRKWLGPDVKITILSGRSSFRWPEENEVVITNPAILPKSPGESKMKAGKIVGPPPEVPAATEPPEGVVLIVDEAHEYTNPKAQQTRRIRHLCRLVRRKKGKTWALTATPIANKHDDLWNVLEVFGLADVIYGSYERYSKLWGVRHEEVKPGYFVKKWGDPEPEVVELLKPWMLRRNKADVLPELPKLTFDTIVVEVDKSALKLCDAAMAELKSSGFDLDKAIEVLEEGKGGVSFQALSKALEALSRVKAPAALEQVAEFEAQDEPVIFFAAHIAVVEAVSKRRGWGMITGERSTINIDGTPRTVQRTEVVRAFQEGELEHGVAATIQAMGTGATLTRATRAFFHSRLFSATKNLQAIGRIERFGQDKPMRVTNLAANHPLDIRLAEIVEFKLNLHANVVDAAAVPVEDLSKIRDNTLSLEVAATKVMEKPAPLRPRLERGH